MLSLGITGEDIMSTAEIVDFIDGSSADELRGDPITGDRYWDPAFMEREWDHMWTRIWHIGGWMAELQEPGDYVVHNFRYESVIMILQDDGKVKAFYNSCQHRGNRLAWSQSGSGDGFTCSYHGWHYGVDGVLKHAQDPDDFEGGDPCGRVSLVEVPCDTWGGLIWYSMDEDAPALMDYLAPMPALFRNRDLDTPVRVIWRTFEVDANWKFASDNFNESYHLPTVHPELRTTTDEDYKNTQFFAYPSGHNMMIEQGQPSMRADKPNEVEPPFDIFLSDWGLDPADFAGRSRDGRLAIQTQKRKLWKEKGYLHYEKMTDGELTDFYHHTLFPNVTMTGNADGIHIFRTEPHLTDPNKCTFDYWYLANAVEGEEAVTIVGPRAFEEAPHEHFVYGSGAVVEDMMESFLIQDLSVAVGQQKGLHSRGYKDAILAGQESRIRRFHEVLNDYLEGRR
jgi:phenylpropionate dioxygenase-like ring-hydroxylating dioxygenase large terminal subunit